MFRGGLVNTAVTCHFFSQDLKTHPKHRPLLLSRAMAAADVAGGRRWSGRRWRASVAGVGGGRRWRASLAGSSSLLRACAFLPYLIVPLTGPLRSARSFGPVPRLVGICTPRVRRQDEGCCVWPASARTARPETPHRTSEELGGRQAAGVIWPEARLAWALATRVKNALRSLGTLRRTRGFSRS